MALPTGSLEQWDWLGLSWARQGELRPRPIILIFADMNATWDPREAIGRPPPASGPCRSAPLGPHSGQKLSPPLPGTALWAGGVSPGLGAGEGVTCPRPHSQFQTEPRLEPYVVGNEGPVQSTSFVPVQKQEPLLRAVPGSDPML